MGSLFFLHAGEFDGVDNAGTAEGHWGLNRETGSSYLNTSLQLHPQNAVLNDYRATLCQITSSDYKIQTCNRKEI